MKSFQDRIWLILLGVAVAIVVMLTTLFRNDIGTSSAGSKAATPKTSDHRAIVPKIGAEISRQLIRPLLPAR